MASRRGTEKRRRQLVAAMRATPDEMGQIRAAAAAEGVSVAEFLRRAATTRAAITTAPALLALSVTTLRVWPDPDNVPFGTLEQIVIRSLRMPIEDNEEFLSIDSLKWRRDG